MRQRRYSHTPRAITRFGVESGRLLFQRETVAQTADRLAERLRVVEQSREHERAVQRAQQLARAAPCALVRDTGFTERAGEFAQPLGGLLLDLVFEFDARRGRGEFRDEAIAGPVRAIDGEALDKTARGAGSTARVDRGGDTRVRSVRRRRGATARAPSRPCRPGSGDRGSPCRDHTRRTTARASRLRIRAAETRRRESRSVRAWSASQPCVGQHTKTSVRAMLAIARVARRVRISR